MNNWLLDIFDTFTSKTRYCHTFCSSDQKIVFGIVIKTFMHNVEKWPNKL